MIKCFLALLFLFINFPAQADDNLQLAQLFIFQNTINQEHQLQICLPKANAELIIFFLANLKNSSLYGPFELLQKGESGEFACYYFVKNNPDFNPDITLNSLILIPLGPVHQYAAVIKESLNISGSKSVCVNTNSDFNSVNSYLSDLKETLLKDSISASDIFSKEDMLCLTFTSI